MAWDPLDESMEVRRYAARIRSAYIKERSLFESKKVNRAAIYTPGPQWDGGITRAKQRRKAIWPTIAKFALSKGLHPEQLIAAVFETATRAEAPLPTMFCTPEAERSYRKQMSIFETTLEDTGNSEAGLFSLCYSDWVDCFGNDKASAQTWVLFDDALAISPLMRYSIASLFGCEPVRHAYEATAMFQYSKAPELYDRFWSKYLPPDIQEVAARCLAEELQGADCE